MKRKVLRITIGSADRNVTLDLRLSGSLGLCAKPVSVSRKDAESRQDAKASPDKRRILLNERQNRVTVGGRQHENSSLNSGGLQFIERRPVGVRAEDGY